MRKEIKEEVDVESDNEDLDANVTGAEAAVLSEKLERLSIKFGNISTYWSNFANFVPICVAETCSNQQRYALSMTVFRNYMEQNSKNGSGTQLQQYLAMGWCHYPAKYIVGS